MKKNRKNFLIAILENYDDTYCVFNNDSNLMNGIKTLFCSSGGKFFVEGKLIKMFPKHKRYLEVFSENSSMLFRKKPSKEEFINVRNIESWLAYTFIQNITEDDKNALKNKNWVIDKDEFKKMLEEFNASGPHNDAIDRFYQHAYLTASSKSGNKVKFDEYAQGEEIKIVEQLDAIKERLKDVVIESMDYQGFINKHSNDDTFVYMGPAYSGENAVTKKEFSKLSKSLESNWMAVYAPCDEWNDEKYHKKMLTQFNLLEAKKNNVPRKSELVITNYAQTNDADYFLENVDHLLSRDMAENMVSLFAKRDTFVSAANYTSLNEMKSVIKLYSAKRRGNKIEESYDQIKNSFKSVVGCIIKEGVHFDVSALPRYAKELFDEFTVYSTKKDDFYMVLKEADNKIGNFIYCNHYSKTNFIESHIRNNFIISTDLGFDLMLEKDIAEGNNILYFKNSNSVFHAIKEGTEYLPPETDKNKTEYPSWRKRIMEGKISILPVSNVEKRVELLAENFRKVLKITRMNQSTDFWVLEQ